MNFLPNPLFEEYFYCPNTRTWWNDQGMRFINLKIAAYFRWNVPKDGFVAFGNKMDFRGLRMVQNILIVLMKKNYTRYLSFHIFSYLVPSFPNFSYFFSFFSIGFIFSFFSCFIKVIECIFIIRSFVGVFRILTVCLRLSTVENAVFVRTYLFHNPTLEMK